MTQICIIILRRSHRTTRMVGANEVTAVPVQYELRTGFGRRAGLGVTQSRVADFPGP